MKKTIRNTLLISILLMGFTVFNVNAQCKSFARNICKEELGSFTHDGNYHAAVLAEGEEAEMYKTFYSDQEYRVAICGTDELPPVEFKVMDANKNIIFSNKEGGYGKTWDFKLESSQQLKLIVKVTTFEQPGEEPSSGCVAIMFGFKVK